jgi:hypothetical protein
MKTVILTFTAALIISNSIFAGAGTLFKGGIGLPDWPLTASAPVNRNSAKQTATKQSRFANRGQSQSNLKQTDHRVTSR